MNFWQHFQGMALEFDSDSDSAPLNKLISGYQIVYYACR